MESKHISKAKQFIREHLKKEFALNELANYVGYSAFHLAREFKSPHLRAFIITLSSFVVKGYFLFLDTQTLS